MNGDHTVSQGRPLMRRFVMIVIVATVAIWISVWGCGDDSDSPTAVEMKAVKVVVLRNGTDYRLPDAYIVVDGNTDDACYTAGPGDTDGGDCDFSTNDPPRPRDHHR